ncbi:MAG: helicase C-terminal domain-containing protein, partial [Carnobacterium sp.]
YTKAKYQLLAQQQLNPFSVDALPKATLRLRQGLGRLIRSEQDKGILLILDDRLFKTNYGKHMLQALPKELPKESLTIKEISAETKKFLR